MFLSSPFSPVRGFTSRAYPGYHGQDSPNDWIFGKDTASLLPSQYVVERTLIKSGEASVHCKDARRRGSAGSMRILPLKILKKNRCRPDRCHSPGQGVLRLFDMDNLRTAAFRCPACAVLEFFRWHSFCDISLQPVFFHDLV